MIGHLTLAQLAILVGLGALAAACRAAQPTSGGRRGEHASTLHDDDGKRRRRW